MAVDNWYCSTSLQLYTLPLSSHVARKLLSRVYAIIVTLNTITQRIVLDLLYTLELARAISLKISGNGSSVQTHTMRNSSQLILSSRRSMFNSRDYVKYMYIIAEKLLPFALLSFMALMSNYTYSRYLASQQTFT